MPLHGWGEDVREKAAFGKIPIRFRHFGRAGREPEHAEGAVSAPPFDPAARTQLGKAPSQGRKLSYQIDVVIRVVQAGPVDPAGRIVLAISIVVAVLAVSHFIAGQ